MTQIDSQCRILCSTQSTIVKTVCEKYHLEQMSKPKQQMGLSLERIMENKQIESQYTVFDSIQQSEVIVKMIESIDNRVIRSINRKEEEIYTLVSRTFNNERQAIKDQKQKLFDKLTEIDQRKCLNSSDIQQQKQYEHMNLIMKQITILVDQFESDNRLLINQIQKMNDKYNDVLKLQCIYNLQQCHNEIQIDSMDDESINHYKKQIQKYRKKNEEYRIQIDWWSTNSLDEKMKAIQFIDQMGLNNRVAIICIELNDRNQINNQIIQEIMTKYNNLYKVFIEDRQDVINQNVNDQLKQLIKQQPLIQFCLWFRGNIQDCEERVVLMKQYNQIIKSKKYLQHLQYIYKDRINQNGDSEQSILNLIDQIDQIQNI